jgi:hypothetical protein
VTKKPEKINLKEEKAYFGSWLQRFQSVVIWLHCYGLIVKQNIMVGAVAEQSSSLHGNQEAERDREGWGREEGGREGLGTKHTLQSPPLPHLSYPLNCFL